MRWTAIFEHVFHLFLNNPKGGLYFTTCKIRDQYSSSLVLKTAISAKFSLAGVCACHNISSLTSFLDVRGGNSSLELHIVFTASLVSTTGQMPSTIRPKIKDCTPPRTHSLLKCSSFFRLPEIGGVSSYVLLLPMLEVLYSQMSSEILVLVFMICPCNTGIFTSSKMLSSAAV